MAKKWIPFIFMFATSFSFAGELPSWVVKGKLADSAFHYVVCSQAGIDPQETRLRAEESCLSQAAKLGGVEVKITQKTIQGLTGADSSEVSEIKPISKFVNCEWIDQHLEEIEKGFRIWLRCRVKKSDIKKMETQSKSLPEPTTNTPPKYRRAYLTITSAPTPDKIIVHGPGGERVIDTKSNHNNVELKEGDHSITVKKHRYKDQTHKISEWKHGDSLTLTVYLEQEI